MEKMRQHWWLFVGLALGLGLRLTAVHWVAFRLELRLPDSELYERYAASILDRFEFEVDGDRARRAPGYPLFIAACWRLSGESHALRFVLWSQALCSTLTALAVYSIARHVESSAVPTGTAMAAAVFCLLDPYAVALCAFELSESFSTFLTVLCVALALKRTRLCATMSGITAGIAVLARPSGALLAPLAAGAWWMASPQRDVVRKRVPIAASAFLVTLLPWWIRNAVVLGAFVPTTLNVGESLFDGLGPQANGASNMQFLEQARSDPAIRNLSEVERDRHWRQRAIAAAWDDPARVVRLATVKFARFWSPWPNDMQFRRMTVVAVTGLATAAVWIFAAAGVWMHRRNAAVLLLGLLPSAYFCALHLVFVSSVRYRAAAAPWLCLLAAAGFMSVLEFCKRSRCAARSVPNS